MFNLDPGKVIVIAVVAIILLGPDKLPQFARQVGGAWRTFNDFRHRMESEVRSSMPDLPPTSEIARLARSPSALLHHLSTMSDEEKTASAEAGVDGAGAAGEAPDGSYQPPDLNGVGDGAPAANVGNGGEGATAPGEPATAAAADGIGANGAHGAHDGSGTGDATAPPTTNGRPAVAPQPADVAVPADPTLN